MTPSGIEPATFQFIAQYLNHCATAVPNQWSVKHTIWIELNGIWVWALPGLMHLGLRTGPLYPMFCTKLEKPCSFSKVPDGPYTYFPDILWVQKGGTLMCKSKWSQGLTLAQNVGWGFLLSTTFPTSGVITQLHYTRVAQKVMPHIFFLGNYLFRTYEIHAQYNCMFLLHMLFFHIICGKITCLKETSSTRTGNELVQGRHACPYFTLASGHRGRWRSCEK
jgi:hypothetical protein